MTDMRVPYGIETRVQESLRVSIRLVVRGFEIQTNKQTNKQTGSCTSLQRTTTMYRASDASRGEEVGRVVEESAGERK